MLQENGHKLDEEKIGGGEADATSYVGVLLETSKLAPEVLPIVD